MCTLTSEQLVQNVNTLKYPPTFFSHGWIYGVWYCGTSFQKAVYYGQYPVTFTKRVAAMFPGEQMLHLCAGRARIGSAVNVDLHPLPETDLQADVEFLPIRSRSIGVVVIDPPYSEEDATRYKCPRLIRAGGVLEECRRVLVPGGWIAWLDEKYPSYRRKDMRLRGLIGIVTGFERRARLLSLFQTNVD